MKIATDKENKMDLTSFKNYLSINIGKKATTSYLSQMNSFFIQYPEFTQDNINAYLTSKIDVWCDGSTNMFLKAVRWYMKFIKIEIELPKFKQVEIKPRPYLEEKEILKIFEYLPVLFQESQKVRIILELLFLSGMRPEEIYTLKRENINLDELKINLINTKSHHSRTVFIPKEFAERIRPYFNCEEEKENAFNLSEHSIGYYCGVISKQTQIKITPYMLRHSYAHNFLNKSGNDLTSLSQLLGHKTLSSTTHYCKKDENKLQDIYNKAFKQRRKK